MKHFLLAAGVALASLASAQNIQEQDVTFKYTQLPIVPINDGTMSYNVVVTMNYLTKNDDSTAAYNTKMQLWQTEVNLALDNWDAEKLKADKQYYSSMMIWETQVAAGSTTAVKPIRQPYPAPNIKARPRKPYLLTELNSTQIISGIKIEGMTPSASSAVKVELIYEGFERGIPQMKQTGVAPNIKYYYEVTYRHPVTLKIDVPGRGLVVNERVPGCEGYRSARTAEYKTQAEVEMYWLENQKMFWDEKQAKAPNETVAEINSYLTEKVGYPVKSRRAEIRTVKSKEHDYTDLLTAYTNFQDGVMSIQYKDKKSKGQDKIQLAIDAWEKALTESNLNDKNARIDKNVTAALYVNLCEAYLWMDDFSNSELNGNKAVNTGTKYGRDAEGRLVLVKFQKDRFMANE
jgi:hypothetical protein